MWKLLRFLQANAKKSKQAPLRKLNFALELKSFQLWKWISLSLVTETAQRVLLDFCGGEQSWKLWELFSLHHHHRQNLSSIPQFRVCKPKFTVLERVSCPDQYYFLKGVRPFPNIGICLLECPRIKLWNLWHRDNFKAEMCSGPPLLYLKFSGWWFSPKKLDALCVLYWKKRWNCFFEYVTY